MKKKILLLCLVVGCVSRPSPPKNTLSSDVMSKILVEIHLTEARVSRMSFQEYDSSIVAIRFLKQKIYQRHKTDSTTFQKSYSFYAQNPPYMNEIYKKVVEILEKKKKL